MKKTILIIVFISTIFNCIAQVEKYTQENKKATDALRKLDSLGISRNIHRLSQIICGYFVGDGTKVAEYTKNAILRHMAEYENIQNPTLPQIIEFLNTNRNYMTCGDDNKNYMMVSFEHGKAYNQLFNTLYFDEFLPDDENLNIDINVISYTGPNGNPETLLDYMYRMFNHPYTDTETKREVKELIDMFEYKDDNLNAKRYSKLSVEEKDEMPLPYVLDLMTSQRMILYKTKQDYSQYLATGWSIFQLKYVALPHLNYAINMADDYKIGKMYSFNMSKISIVDYAYTDILIKDWERISDSLSAINEISISDYLKKHIIDNDPIVELWGCEYFFIGDGENIPTDTLRINEIIRNNEIESYFFNSKTW